MGELLLIGGTLTSVYSSYESGKDAAEPHKLARDWYRQMAREAKTDSAYQVRLLHEAGAEVLGGIEAETGAGGLAMTGTPLANLVHNARQVEMSAAVTKLSGAREAWTLMTAGEMEALTVKQLENLGKTQAWRDAFGGGGGMWPLLFGGGGGGG